MKWTSFYPYCWYKRNAAKSEMTSFPALKSDFRGKWKWKYAGQSSSKDKSDSPGLLMLQNHNANISIFGHWKIVLISKNYFLFSLSCSPSISLSLSPLISPSLSLSSYLNLLVPRFSQPAHFLVLYTADPSLSPFSNLALNLRTVKINNNCVCLMHKTTRILNRITWWSQLTKASHGKTSAGKTKTACHQIKHIWPISEWDYCTW